MHRGVIGALLVACLALASMTTQASAAPAVEARLTGLQDFTLEFAQSMQTWDNAVRTDVVRITPSTPATCSWDTDTRLACHLDSKLAQATRYRLDISPGLKTQAGPVLAGQILFVETARPQAGASITGWHEGVPDFQIRVNMPVEAAALRSVLRLELDGRAMPMPELRALPRQWRNDTRTLFGFDAPRTQGGSHLLVLRVKPGMHASVGPLPGQQNDVLLRARISEPFALQGVVCMAQGDRVLAPVRDGVVDAHCLPGQPVHLVFSHQLDPQSRQAVTMRVAQAGGPRLFNAEAREISWFQRSSPFEAQGIDGAPVDWSAIGEFAPGLRVELQLDDTLRDEHGAGLPPVTVRIHMGDAQPQLRASRDHALVADGRQAPPLVEATNAGNVVLDVRGVGAQVRSEVVPVRSPRRDNVARPIASAVATQTLAEGGWLRWTPQDKGADRGWRARGPVDFAAPAFDLLALSGRREVLAWANEWGTDAPVAGAEIELLWLEPGATQPRVVTRGRTDVDGTVLLRLPDDLVVPEAGDDDHGKPVAAKPMWLLRAASSAAAAERRAVLPMGEIDSYAPLGQPDPRRMWGVSDRPLYHAGDTVHYRLWQREMDGTRLRAPRMTGVMPLRLQNGEDDKVVLEWQATPAADGSITGDLTLPIHLTDATYCLGIDDGHENTDGSCFFVGTYRAQDLWLEAKSRGGILRDGDRFVADARAGYFSGGPAAGAEVTSAVVSLQPEALEATYPQYADFTFIDVENDDTEYVELAGVDAYKALDGDGAVEIDVPVVFEGKPEEIEKRPAFGLLATELEVAPEDREGTSAHEQATRYARYDRYVGLRAQPEWFGADDPVRLEAVVITADGKEVAAAPVEVIVEYMTNWDYSQAGERIARCVLRTRQPAPCEFARNRTGVYRFTARSGTAAPATLQRYVWWRGHGLHVDVEPELAVLEASPQRDVPARMLIKQPFDHARALFAITLGGTILGHRVETIEGNAQEVSLPLAREWRGILEVKALVRETVAAKVEAGFRQPPCLESLEASLFPAASSEATPPVRVRFQSMQARPGARARITLRNDSKQPRDVALAVMDDALRAQAQRWLPYGDPNGPTSFRESLLMRGGGGSVNYTGFDDWTGQEWRWLLPLAKEGADKYEAAAKRGRVQQEAPAPAFAYAESEATVLDRIEVTGSRIKRTEIAESNEAKAPDPALRMEREMPRRGPASAPAGLTVRTQFADTALWMPDIHLAPGESRDIDVELPDNLTRWRAVAWSADAGDDFAMAEAALEVGLPVEARLQAPVRLYPGDTSRVATSVRHVAATPATVQTTLRVAGTGTEEAFDDTQSLALTARGQGSVATTLKPQREGEIQLTATARTPAGGDAVAGRIEVASPLIATRKLQAGWIGDEALHLALPSMPEHAHDPSLQVSLLRGGAGLTTQWTQDLRMYPHRCWEQILSRAVGAALALERQDPNWPDADAVVREALDNAAVFQLDDGGFVYFPGMGDYEPDASVTLTAYTLRAFALLQALGYPISERIETSAREFLAGVDAPERSAGRGDIDEEALASYAFATATRAPDHVADLDPLWAHWNQLPLPVQVASVQAFARAGHPASARAMKRLLAQAPARGHARSLRLSQRYDAWMSSNLREQCALIELLREHPQLANAQVRRELLAGMNDLYAGGVSSVDTQTAAYCLMALRDPPGAATAPAQVRFAIGNREQVLDLAQGEVRDEWRVGTPDGAELQVNADRGNAVPVSYVAELTYLEDGRTAQPSAIGLSIERRHEVLRDGAWKPVEDQSLHEGDWIRVTLAVRTTASREFVAVTDAVPGGLQPTDLELSGVGTAELKRIADEGSGYFETRQLDARHPRFYAESLPAGYHEVHYFARVGNSGDYLAAPATAELMYGEATYARTAATRLRIEAPASR